MAKTHVLMGWMMVVTVFILLGKEARIHSLLFDNIGDNVCAQSTQCPLLREACQKVTPGCDKAVRSLQVSIVLWEGSKDRYHFIPYNRSFSGSWNNSSELLHERIGNFYDRAYLNHHFSSFITIISTRLASSSNVQFVLACITIGYYAMPTIIIIFLAQICHPPPQLIL